VKWEYDFDVLKTNDGPALRVTLNAKGAEGWEVTGLVSWSTEALVTVWFKRPALPPAYLVTEDGKPPVKLTELEAELYSVIAPKRKDLLPSQILDLIRQPYPPTDRPRLPPDGPATTSGSM
jgi:hypothetical protein